MSSTTDTAVDKAADATGAAEAYERLRARASRALTRGRTADAAGRLLERAAATDRLHARPVVDGEPRVARDQSTLLRELHRARRVRARLAASEAEVPVAEDHALARSLWLFAEGLDDAERRLFDVLLRRGLDPFDALDTVPLEAFFDGDEIAALQRARPARKENVRPRLFTWSPGLDADYGGYVGLIFKVTRWCNLRCTYCHDWRTGPGQAMPFDVLLPLFSKLLGAPSHGEVDVIWHGGEPTLVGRRAFLRILALQRYLKRPGQVIENSIQTNATRLDGEWIDFLRRFRFSVSASIDGPPQVHDRTRVGIAGQATFAEVRRGLGLLREAGLLGGVLLVVTPELLELSAEQLLDFFDAEGIGAVDLLPARPDNGTGEGPYVPPERYARFLLELHRARGERPEPVRIRMLDSVLRAVRGEMPGYCELLGNCIGSFFAVDPDGTVSHCDKFIGDPDYELGNILTQDFDELRRGQAAEGLRRANAEALAKQAECEHFHLCRGWCPHERYIHGLRGEVPNCCGLGPLIEQLRREQQASSTAASAADLRLAESPATTGAAG